MKVWTVVTAKVKKKIIPETILNWELLRWKIFVLWSFSNHMELCSVECVDNIFYNLQEIFFSKLFTI